MDEVRCDRTGCPLGPLSEEESQPRYYRIKDDPAGPLLRQRMHDVCHLLFLEEKAGFEAAEFPKDFRSPPQKAGKGRTVDPEGESRGFSMSIENGNATFENGPSRIVMPTRDVQRFGNLLMSSGNKNTPLPLGAALRAKLLARKSARKS